MCWHEVPRGDQGCDKHCPTSIGGPERHEPRGLESCGVMMFKAMQQMQETQNKMLDAILDGGTRFGRVPRSLQDVKPPQDAGPSYSTAAAPPPEPSRRTLMPPPLTQPQPLALTDTPRGALGTPTLTDGQPSGEPPACRPLDASEKQRRRELAAAFAKTQSVAPPKRSLVGDVIAQMVQERAKENSVQKKLNQEAVKADAGGAATPSRCAKKADDGVLATPSRCARKADDGVLATPHRCEPPKAIAVRAKRAKTEFEGCDVINWRPTALGEGAKRWCNTCYNHHSSRNEVVLRSGFRGCGQSRTIKYGTATSEFGSAEAAIAAATLWVETQTGVAHALGGEKHFCS